MPCPFFEPVRTISRPSGAQVRLPLLEEHDGFCHAAAVAMAVPAEMRFRACNHGYSGKSCGHWPAEETRSALRYSVAAHSAEALDLICLAEKDHTPVEWLRVRYLFGTGTLEPMLADACMQAQALAFCRAYLRRFVLAGDTATRVTS